MVSNPKKIHTGHEVHLDDDYDEVVEIKDMKRNIRW